MHLQHYHQEMDINNYNQAVLVGEVQLPQSDSVEAAKDHQQLPQVNRVQNPAFNESVTSALLAQQLPPFQSLV